MNLLPDLFVYIYFFEWVLTKLGYARAEFPIITRPSASNIALRPLEFGGVLRDEPTRKVFFGMTITPWDEVLSRLSPVQTDARLLASNSQLCWMLHVASFCTPCCMLLPVFACCCAKFETSQTFFVGTLSNLSSCRKCTRWGERLQEQVLQG